MKQFFVNSKLDWWNNSWLSSEIAYWLTNLNTFFVQMEHWIDESSAVLK